MSVDPNAKDTFRLTYSDERQEWLVETGHKEATAGLHGELFMDGKKMAVKAYVDFTPTSYTLHFVHEERLGLETV